MLSSRRCTRPQFRLACGSVRRNSESTLLSIVSTGSGSGDGLERGIQARKETLIAMKLLSDCMGPIIWEVIGNSCSLCDQVSWQTAER